jgi:hypothetical protein
MLPSLSRAAAQFWNRTPLKKVHFCETTVSTVESRYRTSILSHTTSVPIAAARVTCVLVSRKLFERDYEDHVNISHPGPLIGSSQEQGPNQ